MSDTDSSEVFGQNQKGSFSGQIFKSFAPPGSNSQSSSSSGIGANLGMAPGLGVAAEGSAAASGSDSAAASPSDSGPGEYVLSSRTDDHQLREIAGLPFDLFKQFLYGWLPQLAPAPTDPAEVKAKKQQHLAKLQELDQASRQVYLQKAQAWQQRQEAQEAERQAKKEAEAAQKDAAGAVAPAGKRSGAYDPHSNSQKTNTDELLKRQRQANADRTQGAD